MGKPAGKVEEALIQEGWKTLIYDCTMEEAAQRFGVFLSSDRRPQLWDQFTECIREAESCRLIEAVLLNGSFVTAKNEPNDIDPNLDLTCFEKSRQQDTTYLQLLTKSDTAMAGGVVILKFAENHITMLLIKRGGFVSGSPCPDMFYA